MRAANEAQSLRKGPLTSVFPDHSCVLILQGPVSGELSLQHFPQYRTDTATLPSADGYFQAPLINLVQKG